MDQPSRFNIHDVRAALGALTSDRYIAAAGIDAAFIEMFARNLDYFDQLPKAARDKIRDQWAAMALEKSYRTSVLQKASEEKSRAMAEWMKGVNLLLALAKSESHLQDLPEGASPEDKSG